MKSEIRPFAGMYAGRLWLRRFVLAAAAALSAGHAVAQSVDYTSMEQIFGEPVTNSATGSPLRASQVPADMVILTQDDIRRSGADTLPDLLRFVPGLDVRETAVLGSSVGVRGYNGLGNPRLLVLVNGQPIYDEFEAGVYWNAVPVQLGEIRQIEIVKGPSSALFGFNAASGVINIVTFDPLYDDVTTATVATGTQSLAEANATATYRRDGVGGLRVSVGALRLNEFAASPDRATEPLHPKNAEASLEGRWLIHPGLEFTVEASGLDERENADIGVPAGFSVRTNAVRAELAAQTSIGRLSVAGYRNGAGILTIQNTGYTYDVYDLQIADLFKIGAAHTLRVNVEVKDDSATSAALIGGTAGYTDYAASLMWNWQIRPTLALNSAIRADQLFLRYSGTRVPGSGVAAGNIDSASDFGFSFNSGLVWSLTDLDTVQVVLGRGLELPSLLDLSFQSGGGGLLLVGDPQLAPTAVTSAELSYARTLQNLAANLRLSLFAERNDDLAVPPFYAPFQPTPTGLLARAANIGHSDEAGLELTLKGTLPHGLRWNAGYVYTDITDHIHAGLPASSDTRYSDGTPRNVLIFGLGATEGKWEADVNGRWQSDFVDDVTSAFGSRPDRIGDYLTLSARIGYHVFGPLTAAVTSQQLLRERIAETSGVEVERRVLVSLTAKF